MNKHATPSVHPPRVEGELDSTLSRWLWLVKWVLVIPHVLALVFLWIAFVVLPVVAFFAILFTGRYPPFTLADVPDYATLMTDAYPPFRLDMGGQEPQPASAGTDAIRPKPVPELS